MPSARDLLAAAADRLAAAGVPSPRVDAELLLAHVTGRPRALLRMAEVTDEESERFATLVALRSDRVPMQHLTGSAPFRYLELVVGPGVFVPRPETELVVDAVLAHLRAARSAGARPLLVDLCSGSGALALALATEIPGSRVIAVELSEHAAEWLRRNRERHADAWGQVGSTLEVEVADATTVAEPGGPLADLRGTVDVVVTNPPYVPDGAIPREPEVRDHDPALALYGGPDGLDVVRPLARQAALLLRPGGLVAVEHADVQGEDAGPAGVPGLLRGQAEPVAALGGSRSAWVGVTDHRDLAGLPRFTTAVRAGTAAGPGDDQRGRMDP